MRVRLTSHVSNLPVHASDVNPLKPRNGVVSKDEIRSATDLRVKVDLISLVSQEGILIPDESGAVEATVRVRAQRDGLAALAKRVLHIDVVQPEAVALDAQRGRLVVAVPLIRALGLHDVHRVARVRGVVLGGPVHGELGCALWHEDLLLVGAGSDEDALRLGGGGGQGVDGGLDGREVVRHGDAALWR